MFKLTNQLFCNHEYKYFNTTKEVTWNSFYKQYHFYFICPKCKKVISVNENEIDKTYEYYRMENKKAMACGEPISAQKNEFTIPQNMSANTTYTGVAAQLTLDYYAEKGIDLKQISCS